MTTDKTAKYFIAVSLIGTGVFLLLPYAYVIVNSFIKTGSGSFAGLPREAVDRRKQERLRAAAACYLRQHDLDAPARFDVAEVYTDGVHRPLRLEYLENAF